MSCEPEKSVVGKCYKLLKEKRTICQTIKRPSQNLSLIFWSTSIKVRTRELEMITIQQTLAKSDDEIRRREYQGEKFLLQTRTITSSLSLENNVYLVSSRSTWCHLTLKDLCTIIWMGVSFINFQTEPQELLADAAAVGAESLIISEMRRPRPLLLCFVV